MKPYLIVLVLLLASNVLNGLFLFLDPRNPSFSLVTWLALGSVGTLYLISFILCLWKKRVCYFLNVFLGVVSSPIVVADNLNFFLSSPTTIIYFLNFVFLAVQILLVAFSMIALKNPFSTRRSLFSPLRRVATGI